MVDGLGQRDVRWRAGQAARRFNLFLVFNRLPVQRTLPEHTCGGALNDAVHNTTNGRVPNSTKGVRVIVDCMRAVRLGAELSCRVVEINWQLALYEYGLSAIALRD